MKVRWRSDADSGVATVWAAGAIAAILLVFAVVIWLGVATVARHRATSAADLAAVSAAGHVRDGGGVACGHAERVAGRMGAVLESCELRGWDALVRVSVRPGGALAGFAAAVGRARAGPESEP